MSISGWHIQAFPSKSKNDQKIRGSSVSYSNCRCYDYISVSLEESSSSLNWGRIGVLETPPFRKHASLRFKRSLLNLIFRILCTFWSLIVWLFWSHSLIGGRDYRRGRTDFEFFLTMEDPAIGPKRRVVLGGGELLFLRGVKVVKMQFFLFGCIILAFVSFLHSFLLLWCAIQYT